MGLRDCKYQARPGQISRKDPDLSRLTDARPPRGPCLPGILGKVKRVNRADDRVELSCGVSLCVPASPEFAWETRL
jgi:hypothetical protein